MTWGWISSYGLVFLELQKEERCQKKSGPFIKQTFIWKIDSRSKPTSTAIASGRPQSEFIPSALGPKATEAPAGNMEDCEELHPEKT